MCVTAPVRIVIFVTNYTHTCTVIYAQNICLSVISLWKIVANFPIHIDTKIYGLYHLSFKLNLY